MLDEFRDLVSRAAQAPFRPFQRQPGAACNELVERVHLD